MNEFEAIQSNILKAVESAVQSAIAQTLASVRDEARKQVDKAMTDETIARYYPHDSMTQEERAECVNEWTDDLLSKSMNCLASVHVKAAIEKKAGLA